METLHSVVRPTRSDWLRTLSRIAHPKDCWKVANINAQFKNILKTDLPQKWTEALLFATFPNVSKYLSIDECLTLRLVTNSTKLTVDYYLIRDEIEVFAKSPKQLDLVPYMSPDYQCCKLDDLQLKMRSSHLAKIRRLSVDCRGINENFEDCRPFFQEFGYLVVELKIHVVCSEEVEPSYAYPLECLKMIRDVLLHTPNLKILDFLLPCNYLELGPPYKLWVDRVCQFWTENPVPELPHLKKLIVVHQDCKEDSGFPCFGSPTLKLVLIAYQSSLKDVEIFMPKSMGQ